MSITDFFAIISKTQQMVLNRFWGRTNISLRFLSPWLDCGIDIRGDFTASPWRTNSVTFILIHKIFTKLNHVTN